MILSLNSEFILIFSLPLSMLILQIETATAVCSVALSDSGKTIYHIDVDEPNVHASKLTRLVEKVMSETGYSLNNLDAIAVSKGPGSYTGLRIGVSTAKGLCYGLEKPLIAVDSLLSLASGYVKTNQSVPSNALLYPMIDARRREVYTAVYNQALQLKIPTGAEIIGEDFFNDISKNPVILFGNGADKFANIFSSNDQITVVNGFQQSADYLSEPAFQAFNHSNFEDVAYFEPFYLKDFVPLAPKKK